MEFAPSAFNSFSHKPFAGWSIGNFTSFGGIAAFQNYVYAMDMGPAKGIVRFDVFNNTAARIATATDAVDVNVGVDGKLYTLIPPPPCTRWFDCGQVGVINVYDPVTMVLLYDKGNPKCRAQ